ncbi:hypothetical protein GOP47_0020151 [Adiantum capillus-veneris]|uniref:RST domain-containing protein n=1 Tax=Adiantum capillus-veneris TaxID=13818 RepID=A0A9D4ZAC0_ADICA|nr:hypothetical protein GOP47_0020151 [Adiantum capillus-veneris]
MLRGRCYFKGRRRYKTLEYFAVLLSYEVAQMDRGGVQILEDDEEDKKPLLGSVVEHRNMEFGTTSGSNVIPTFQSLQSTGSMAHNIQSIQAFGQATAHPSQEKSESSTSSTLHQPANHMQHLGSQPQGSQHGDKAQNPGLAKRPGGSAQAISFGTLMPMLLPILPPEKAQSLNALYTRLKKQEISKEDFLRATRLLVGDEILVNTVKNMQIKQLQGQMSRQQAAQTEMPHQLPFPQHSQHIPPQQQQTKSSLEQLQQQRQATLQVQQAGQQHQPQQLIQQMQSSLDVSMHYQANTRVPPMPLLPSEYRQEHRHQVPAASSSLSLQQVKHEVDKSQAAESSSGHGGASANIISSLNTQPGNSTMAPLPSPLSIPDTGTVVASGSQVRTPPKKVTNDLKRPADVSPILQMKSKKQKVAGDVLEQSIDQLNDVTAVSGVNLREEEEQLLAGPKEESRNTQAMRRFAQEEEGRLFLERGPLRTKVNAIAAKHGVSVVTEEAEQCLSMSVEERLRNMLYKLTKISGRRCDQEKEMHKLVVTSDIQKQILLIRKQAKEAQEKKQALETERLRKLNEEKEKSSQNEGASKEDGTTSRTKEKKSQKGDEGKQKANAASIAARSANDMLLKWQMMAEQGRQKREGESGATTANDVSAITSIGAANTSSREVDKKQLETRQTGRAAPIDGGSATTQSALKKVSGDTGQIRHQGSLPNQTPKPPRTITVKDIVAYLETEPQMAKSSLIYRLHNRSGAVSQVAQLT